MGPPIARIFLNVKSEPTHHDHGELIMLVWLGWNKHQNLKIICGYRAGPGILTYMFQVKTRSRMYILALPRVIWLWTLLFCRDGLWCCHVSNGSEPRLPTEVASNTTTCSEAPDLASLLGWAPASSCVLWLWTLPPCRGGLRHCHASYSSQWATGLMNKERHSMPTYAARLAYFQRALACFQGSWHLRNYGRQDVQAGRTIMTLRHADMWL
jgi:hypothetical protein